MRAHPAVRPAQLESIEQAVAAHAKVQKATTAASVAAVPTLKPAAMADTLCCSESPGGVEANRTARGTRRPPVARRSLSATGRRTAPLRRGDDSSRPPLSGNCGDCSGLYSTAPPLAASMTFARGSCSSSCSSRENSSNDNSSFEDNALSTRAGRSSSGADCGGGVAALAVISSYDPSTFMPFLSGDGASAASAQMNVRSEREVRLLFEQLVKQLHKKDDWQARLRALIDLQNFARGNLVSHKPLVVESLRAIKEEVLHTQLHFILHFFIPYFSTYE